MSASLNVQTPRRIRLSREKGWRMPANTVKVDRTTKWGNPYRVGSPQVPDAAWAVACFRKLVAAGDAGMPGGLTSSAIREELRGKNLACWCAEGTPCHAEVLLEIANSEVLP